MRITRRHARALAAGAATTAAYLAGAKLTDSRAIRGGSLLLLGVIGMLGAQATSAQSRTLKTRLDAHVSATSGAVALNASHGTQLTNLANNSSVLLTLAGAVDPSFLASISGPLGHQTTSNANIGATGASWTTAERTAVNGLINAVNNLQSSLQANNIEA